MIGIFISWILETNDDLRHKNSNFSQDTVYIKTDASAMSRTMKSDALCALAKDEVLK